MLRDAADRGFFRFAALLGHTRERTNLRSQTMSGILRAAAPLARRLNAVPKGPIAQQTRGMACECPERRAVSPSRLRIRGWIIVSSADADLPRAPSSLLPQPTLTPLPRWPTPGWT